MQEQFARLLAPSHAILQKLEAQVLAINQSLMALHALTNSLAQNSQRYPGPAQVLEPPGAVEEHSLAADSAPQEVDELPSSARASVLSLSEDDNADLRVANTESEALNPWQALNPRHHILAASPLETSRMHQVTSETASLLEREKRTERDLELAYRIYGFYNASADKDVRSYFANLLKDIYRKFHAFFAFRDPHILKIITKHW